jgi:1,4-dihydroxy-6-naphthoate synthase
MKLTIGFSPCPNDTFIFDALVNGGLHTPELEFQPVLEDVQTLNEWAIKGKLDITKISFGVLPLVTKNYQVLDSGAALGRGAGPLLISKKQQSLENVHKSVIVLPGEHTTAHVLFSMAFPSVTNKVFLRYDEIENFVLKEVNALGVIIHENRFTYQEKGLTALMDLGNFWEINTGLPIPLGGILVKREIDWNIRLRVEKLIHESIQYAFNAYPQLSPFVKRHAQEMNETIMRKHIDLYVNSFSLSLGDEGRNAVKTFLEIHQNVMKLNAGTGNNIFLTSDPGPDNSNIQPN